MQWLHNYSALGDSLGLTAITVSIPIFYLFWALAVKRMKGHIAGLTTLLLTIVVVVVVYGMPVNVAISASVLGMLNGLFPIGWIILTAVFLYNLTVETGQFDIIKSSISSLSPDRRIQALLVAFCFSAFMEGVAGQGAPVAVAAAMLIGLGFPALPAAAICLVGNTPPVPFGPVGTPTIMMATVTELPNSIVGRAIGLDMTILALVIPIFMLVVVAGRKNVMGALPAALVAGISYAVTNHLVSQNFGPELPAIFSSFVSMICLVVFLKFWKPATIWRFPNDSDIAEDSTHRYSAGQIIKAWSPFIILMIVMGIWGTPAFKAWVAQELKWFITIPSWPGLDGIVYRAAPIVAVPSKYAASYRMDFFSAAGTAMLISAILSMVVLGLSPAAGVRVFKKTFNQLMYSLITLTAVLGVGFLANYSGMSYTLGLAFATYTGMFFPIFSPVIGYLGVFLTGSVTSSAALFGKLQQVTASHLGLNPLLTISANLFGAVIGKLISPQSIAVACAATGLVGRETDIFRLTVKYSIYLLLFVIVIILLQAWAFPNILPKIAAVMLTQYS
ncbi:L-lactate permease [Sporomusa sphaeroides]|uniref:L-lactate permease n=1 Tax=Sporomusa sphaeroides DSM 2875 TaxID=1337886 RepID=A0ABM9W2J5_9FIRM|nr:lactate permease LctP family transporter [Sporomusa sphaeroides]OLS55689.1 L-lactate permease [Sporomusa sphaeroides DSM 2875]CVK19385.1 L-lactate permease [Sporomusa sphaeroides DSM 2875]